MLAVAASAALMFQKGLDQSKAELLSQVRTYRPGTPFLVGVHFKIKPGWHVYWRNPGDSGQEVRVKWNLPAGWKASELMWPGPKVFVDAGIVNYGYTDDVSLLAKITPGPGKSGSLRANLQWLVCDKQMCLPATQAVSLQLEAGQKPMAGKDGNRLEGLMNRLPKPMPVPTSASLLEGVFSLKAMIASQGAKSYRFFPDDPTIMANAEKQNWTSEGKWVELLIKKGEFFTKKPSRLKGILSVSDNLHENFYFVDVPLN